MPGCPLRRTCARPLEGALRSKAEGELTLGLMSGGNQKRTGFPVGAGLPAMAVGRSTYLLAGRTLSPASWLLQGKCVCVWINTINCRSWLAGDSGGSVNVCIGWADAIASKPAPTGGMCKYPKLVGPPPCRSVYTTKEPGRLSGRLGGCGGSRPLERPSGGSAQWATRHGCRVSRPRPGMADGGGPTEQDRSEGMASISEPPNERGKSALVTLGLFQSDSP